MKKTFITEVSLYHLQKDEQLFPDTLDYVSGLVPKRTVNGVGDWMTFLDSTGLAWSNLGYGYTHDPMNIVENLKTWFAEGTEEYDKLNCSSPFPFVTVRFVEVTEDGQGGEQVAVYSSLDELKADERIRLNDL